MSNEFDPAISLPGNSFVRSGRRPARNEGRFTFDKRMASDKGVSPIPAKNLAGPQRIWHPVSRRGASPSCCCYRRRYDASTGQRAIAFNSLSILVHVRAAIPEARSAWARRVSTGKYSSSAAFLGKMPLSAPAARRLRSEGELGAKSRNCGHGRQRLHDWHRQQVPSSQLLRPLLGAIAAASFWSLERSSSPL